MGTTVDVSSLVVPPFNNEIYSYALSLPYIYSSLQLVCTYTTGSVSIDSNGNTNVQQVSSQQLTPIPYVLTPIGGVDYIHITSTSDGVYQVNTSRLVQDVENILIDFFPQTYDNSNNLIEFNSFVAGTDSYSAVVPYLVSSFTVTVQYSQPPSVDNINLYLNNNPSPYSISLPSLTPSISSSLVASSLNQLLVNSSYDGLYSLNITRQATSLRNISLVCTSITNINSQLVVATNSLQCQQLYCICCSSLW